MIDNKTLSKSLTLRLRSSLSFELHYFRYVLQIFIYLLYFFIADNNKVTTEDFRSSPVDINQEKEEAAIKIQAGYRGYKTRKNLKIKKNMKEDEVFMIYILNDSLFVLFKKINK